MKNLIFYFFLLCCFGALQAQNSAPTVKAKNSLTLNADNTLSFDFPESSCSAGLSITINPQDSSLILFKDDLSSVSFTMPPGSKAVSTFSFSSGSGAVFVNFYSTYTTYIGTFGFGRSFLPGTYNACLRLTLLNSQNDTMCDNTFCDSIQVKYSTQYCIADFTHSQDPSNPNPSVNFKNQSQHISAYYKLVDYEWDFGDGTTSAQKNPTHNYLNSGTYPVCLIQTIRDSVTLAVLCSDTICKTITASFSCQSSFALDLSSSGSGQINVFNNSSSSLQQGYTIQYFWDFGDGSTSNQAYPTHIYSNPGSYYLCLSQTVISPNGIDSCFSSFCDSIGMDSLGNILQKNGQTGFTLNILKSTIGIEEFSQNEVSIFPNPAKDEIFISLDEQAKHLTSYTLSDFRGSQILKGSINENGTESRIDVSNITNGIYILSIKKGSEIQNRKIVISH